MKKLKGLTLLVVAAVLLAGCGKSEETAKRQQTLKDAGMALQAAGDYEGAIEKYDEALKLADMEVGEAEIDLVCYKASALAKSGDLSGAIDAYSAVLALKKDTTGELYLGRGLLYTRAEKLAQAEEDLNQALKITDDPILKGIIYKVVGQADQAKKYFEEAQKQGDPEALFFLAEIYESAGDHNYAMILLEEYIAGENASAEGCLTVAEYYIQDENYTDALSVIENGLSKGDSPVKKMLLQEEIACYEHLGNFAEAREKAESYLEIYPEDELIQREYEFLKSR